MSKWCLSLGCLESADWASWLVQLSHKTCRALPVFADEDFQLPGASDVSSKRHCQNLFFVKVTPTNKPGLRNKKKLPVLFCCGMFFC